MTISQDLFLSILSIDAYNRGYGEGYVLSGSQVGGATVDVDSRILNIDPNDPNRVDQANGFYAVTYTWGNQTIISYRGTDTFATPNPLLSTFYTQAGQEFLLTDFPIYTGDYDEPELFMAMQFRNAVSASLAPGTPVVLTGHSLGGALAGFTGALFGDQVVAVDHIGFYESLNNFLRDWNVFGQYMSLDAASAIAAYEANHPDENPDITWLNGLWSTFHSYGLTSASSFAVNTGNLAQYFSSAGHFHAFYLNGSIASGIARAGIDNIPITDATLSTTIGDAFFQGLVVVQGLSVAAHSANMNAIFQYARQELLYGTGANGGLNALRFGSVVSELIDALFDDNIGAAAGFLPSGQSGLSGEGAKMRDAIAYSALDGTEGLIFGNTGIRAMFDDANQLGGLVSSGKTTGALDKALSGICETVVEFAGLLAFRKVVSQSTTPNASTATDGILSLLAGGTVLSGGASSTADTLLLNLTEARLGLGAQAGDAAPVALWH